MKFKNFIIIGIMTLLMITLIPKSNAASLTIAFSKSSANVGDKINVTVNGNGIAGKISLSVSGNATLSQSSVWVDNSSTTVTLSINGTGNITVTATPVDASDSTTANPFTTATSGTVKVAEKTEIPAQTSTEKSSVATLANLGIKPNDFSGFKPGTYSYNVEVPNETESIEIYASKGQSGQTISGTGKKTLKEGTNTLSVVVTAEDGKTKKTYTINVTRKAKDEKTEETEETEKIEENSEEQPMEEVFGLSELKIEGSELSPEFKTDVYEYNVNLKENLEKLNITALATKENSNIEITGNENLKEGENIITIIVKGENEAETVTYQIIVNKTLEKQEDTSNQTNQDKIKKIIILSVAGGVILIIIISAIVVKNKKSRRTDDDYIPYENLMDNYNENNEEKQTIEDEENYEKRTKRNKHSKGKRFK